MAGLDYRSNQGTRPFSDTKYVLAVGKNNDEPILLDGGKFVEIENKVKTLVAGVEYEPSSNKTNNPEFNINDSDKFPTCGAVSNFVETQIKTIRETVTNLSNAATDFNIDMVSKDVLMGATTGDGLGSDDLIPTQKAVNQYVDSKIRAVNTTITGLNKSYLPITDKITTSWSDGSDKIPTCKLIEIKVSSVIDDRIETLTTGTGGLQDKINKDSIFNPSDADAACGDPTNMIASVAYVMKLKDKLEGLINQLQRNAVMKNVTSEQVMMGTLRAPQFFKGN